MICGGLVTGTVPPFSNSYTNSPPENIKLLFMEEKDVVMDPLM